MAEETVQPITAETEGAKGKRKKTKSSKRRKGRRAASGARRRLSCQGAMAFRLWTATLYPVEITGGQTFGDRQG